MKFKIPKHLWAAMISYNLPKMEAGMREPYDLIMDDRAEEEAQAEEEKKVIRRQMTKEEIRKWVESEPESSMLDEEGITHVAFGLGDIQDWYNSGKPLGDFLNAVIRNDLMGACGRADKVNRYALFLYVKFLYNCIPGDYIERIKGGKDATKMDSMS